MNKPFLAPGYRDLVPAETETDLIAITAGFTTRGHRRAAGVSAVRQLAQIFEDHECIPMQGVAGVMRECNWELHDDINLNWCQQEDGSAMASLCALYSPEYLGVELPELSAKAWEEL